MEKDLTKGKPWKILLHFAIPLFIGTLFQQIYNIADTIVVGNFIGSQALAAVGTSGVIMNMISSAGLGLATGCSVMISQYVGAKKPQETINAIHISLLSFLVIGILATVIGLLLMNPMLKLLQTPDDMMPYTISYLRVIFMGILFVMLYNILNQVSVAIGDSKTPMWMLLIASILNIILDLVFTLVFHMGVEGIALATMLAQGFAAYTCFRKLKIYIQELSSQPAVFEIKTLKRMLSLGLPAMAQNLISSSGLIAVQGLLNSFGSTTVAAYTAANKIDGIAMSPMVALGNAISTYTSQNIGAREIKRVRHGLSFANLFALLACIIYGLVIFLNSESLLGLFVDQTENQELLSIGSEYLHVAVFIYFMMAIMFILTGLLRGCGDVKVVFICSLLDLGGRTLFAYVFVSLLGRYALWLSYPFGWLLASILGFLRYRSNRWQKIELIDA